MLVLFNNKSFIFYIFKFIYYKYIIIILQYLILFIKLKYKKNFILK